MEKQDVQTQIDQMNVKLDLLLEYIQEQRQKRQVIDDLVDDVSRVGTDIFKSTVTELDRQGIELDPEEMKLLLVRFIKNVQGFNALLAGLQSATDFVKDASPIFREMIIDLTYEMQRLEENGVFDAAKTIARNMTEPHVLQRLANITTVISETKMDETLDNKSLWKLYKEMKSPEVRRGMSYMLRVIKALSIQKTN